MIPINHIEVHQKVINIVVQIHERLEINGPLAVVICFGGAVENVLQLLVACIFEGWDHPVSQEISETEGWISLANPFEQ